MNADRWKQIEDCYHAALERPVPERAAFLAESCADDPGLRREVESLLTHEGQADELLESPAWNHITPPDETGTLAPEALSAGAMMAEYRVKGKLGSGGMGEVYRATDTKLHRDVALKVLPPEFAQNSSWMSRFQREARVLASLNHPNIAAVYGLEESGGVRAIAMELVEGPTLAERIARGRIAIPEALVIARQIAEALEYAHEKGIVHRDLKPANVKLRPDGVVKVLDFGLAKAIEPKEAPAETATHAGVIMGTPAYMAPEQAAGLPVDRRADIWAFGVVLFEMLAGRQMYARKTTLETLAAVARDGPRWDELPAGTPADIRRLLQRCLDKDPKLRLRDIGEARILLREDHAAAKADANVPRPSRQWIPWAAAAVLVALAFLVGHRIGPAVTPPQRLVITIVPQAANELDDVGGEASAPEISPDGSSVLYATDFGLRVRRLDSLEPKLVRGSEEDLTGAPFWSADSKAVIFPTQDLIRVRVPDGAPERIAHNANPSRGGTSSDNGTILISHLGNLYEVTASGGELKLVSAPGARPGKYYYPQFLPGSEDFLCLLNPEDEEGGEVYMATLRDGKAANSTLLMRNDTAARYTPAGGGRILFVRGNDLYSQKLDIKGRKLEGDAELIQTGVASLPGRIAPHANFSVSRTGELAWRSGKAVLGQVTAFDRHGKVIGTSGLPSTATSIALSPDETRLLAHGGSSWLLEIGQMGSTNLGPRWEWEIWSPDGLRLLGVGRGSLAERAVAGTGEVRERYAVEGHLQDISPDGEHVLVMRPGLGAYTMSLQGSEQDRKLKPLIDTGERSNYASFSPDGRWVVYHVRLAIYVQPFPGPGLRTQAVLGGGIPVWRKDGKEILIASGGDVRSVRVDATSGGLRFGAPETLFSGLRAPGGLNGFSHPLAVSRDGSRIFWVQGAEQPESNVINVRMGWESK